ncbi:MAG TPA: imidazole glycerol phosphate synthase subunit HisH [Phycisphaerales bacterium]|nr:imidazole glycerol phosphate synthase subunit HisH [Phycisphaerales bacterium]
MLVIIDYGAGNIRSVINAFRFIGSDVRISCDPADFRQAEGLILPGVGASGYAMRKLAPFAEKICNEVRAGKPLLGICLGFQLLFDESHELGVTRCLGLIGGRVIPIPQGRTIPHMGWNYVEAPDTMRLMNGLKPGRHFAFVHSYYAEVADADAIVARVEYEQLTMAAAIEKGNLFGCQFHPEKSGDDGLQMLRNFVEICRERR